MSETSTQAAELMAQFRIGRVLDETVANVHESLKTGPVRFSMLKAAFEEKYAEGSVERGMAETLCWSLLSSTLSGLYSGDYISVIIELHALLERYSLHDVPLLLARDAKSAVAIESLLSRKVLTDLSETLVYLGVWKAEDAKFAENLSAIRNGIAHKNAKLLSNKLGEGKSLHHLDAVALLYGIDCVPYIIGTVELLRKLCLARFTSPAWHATTDQPEA